MPNSKPCLELLDEAFHLLRGLAPGAWLTYVCCAAPFLLFAAAEWQRLDNPTTPDSQLGHSALLALLYLLFGAGRSLFAGRLRNAIFEESAAMSIRPLTNHLLLHTAELALLPCVLLSVVGFPWTLTFFRFAVCGSEGGVGRSISQAARRASRFHRQAWLVSLILPAVVLATFLNVMAALLIFPDLFKALSGYETRFTRSRAWVLNSLTAALALGITLLLAEAILLATITLVVFYENAERSGRDLLLQLRNTPEARQASSAARIAFLVVGFLALQFAGLRPLRSASLTTPPRAADLDRRIDQVLHQPKYEWTAGAGVRRGTQMPQGGLTQAIAGLLERTIEQISQGLRAFGQWVERLFSKRPNVAPTSSPTGAAGVSLWLLICLGAVAIGGAAALLLRNLRGRTAGLAEAQIPAQSTVDLRSEQVLATALPEEEWLALARKHFAEGEGRLAVRALYLAGLAALGKQEVLTITAFKTNADYKAELWRRVRSQPLVDAFTRNCFRFESTWYGLHEVSPELVESCERDLSSLREPTYA
jgi:hypothetical protein